MPDKRVRCSEQAFQFLSEMARQGNTTRRRIIETLVNREVMQRNVSPDILTTGPMPDFTFDVYSTILPESSHAG